MSYRHTMDDETGFAHQYPKGWPQCPVCGEPSLDGHITCGSVWCDEGEQRRRRAAQYASHAKGNR